MPEIEHTVTAADVKRIYGENLARKKRPFHARQGARTEVHALIHAQCPTPLPLPPPSRAFNLSGIVERDGFLEHDQAHAESEAAAKLQDLRDRKAKMAASIGDADVLEWSKLPQGVGPGTKDQTFDPHHWVQKRHQQVVWAETDRLVEAALGGAQ
jgi:hypothetical protein